MSQPAPTTLSFLEFILDAPNARLWRNGSAVDLRPKSLAVLTYLASRPAQLVTKHELLGAVWPETAVTEWVLTGCIRELRQALGDDSRRPRIIETAHRHGYRFIAQCSQQTPSQAPTSNRRPSARRAAPTVVGRDTEIRQLGLWLDEAFEQRRQIVFVAGEPGIGKTTLIDAFVGALLESGAPALIARGQCIDQHGSGEPYLPMLDALARLCSGAHGDELVPLLRRHAPSWLAQLPVLMDAAEADALERRLGDDSRHRMLREITAFLETLPRPLVLVLEDLHWSDHATLSLLSTLAQRRDPAHLLVIGTYRPVEAALRAHPLKIVHHELRAHGCCSDLWIEPLSQAAVVDYLRARWDGLAEVEALAHTVHQHTDGNPLFLVNVANAMVADGVVVQTDKGWVLRDSVSTLVLGVPLGLRQLIAARHARLSESDREALAAGSLVGRSFCAALVAAAINNDVLAVEECLRRLADRGEVVQAAGETTWPDGTISGAYRFLHALHETVIREHVPPALRQRLHGRIGERLEAAYGPRQSEIAAELAFHFDAGGHADDAVRHIEIAAERAMRLGAAPEAAGLLRRGVALLDALPPSPERSARTIQLCIRLGRALPAVTGFTDPEVERAYERAFVLSQRTDDKAGLIQSVGGLAVNRLANGKFVPAAAAAAEVAKFAAAMPFPGVKFGSDVLNGMVKYHMGPLAEARAHLDAAVEVGAIAFPALSIDPRLIALSYLGVTLLHLGYPDQARLRMRQAADRLRERSRPFDRASLQQMECIAAILLRDQAALATATDEAMAQATDNDFRAVHAVGMAGRGVCLAHTGDFARGTEMMQAGIDAYRTGGHLVALPFLLGTLARVQIDNGDLDGALTSIAESRRLVESTGERRVEAELYRLEGLVGLRRGQAKVAEASFRHAIKTAQGQGARWLELRATTSLAAATLSKGSSSAARRGAYETLRGIAESFREGGDTADVRDAHEVLGQLSARRTGV